ncbi:calcium-binding protein [Neotabrizicola shimadae]|uniref:Uncharacterized protein n=1 Tax=Neotabrizicola shimadae TaxID=2807096 RepID=A0A8G1ECV4_9RHOB|nr:calcium-binding protein [Neotabrizicola shimadae]QYZ70857.1 hypothetical protein JO391_04915 [Neotabrizicola shimadae]
MAIKTGTPDPELLQGTNDPDSLSGLGGDDSIYGMDGNDTLKAGAGNDLINTGNGGDLAYGGDGDDTILGGYGGIDTLYGGAGSDVMQLMEVVTAGLSVAYGGTGDDYFSCTAIGNATVYGGAGIDALGLFWLTDLTPADISISGPSIHARTLGGLEATFTSVERLIVLVGDRDDTIRGGAYDDSVTVGGGANEVSMMGGNDTLMYTPVEANTLYGGAGDDLLRVMQADSSIYFIVDGSDGSVDDGQLSVIRGFERYEVIGSNHDDVASTWNGDDILYGWEGNDTLFGAGGNDMIQGGQDDDQLFGGAGNDTIAPGHGADTADGGEGNDRLFSSADGATLTGGLGSDLFVFRNSELGRTLVTDFETGVDRLSIAAFYATGYELTGRLPEDRLSVGTAVGPQGQFVLVYDSVANETMLVWDRNGSDPSGGVDAIAFFSGNVSMQASDILLS